MSKEDLLLYEMPTVYEFISIGFIQNMFKYYLAKKINRKYRRYLIRLERRKRFKKEV